MVLDCYVRKDGWTVKQEKQVSQSVILLRVQSYYNVSIYYILYTYKRPGNGALSSGTEFMTNMGSEAFEWTLFYLWTGETRKRAGVGRQRYGRRERKLREAGGSDLPVPPPHITFTPINVCLLKCLNNSILKQFKLIIVLLFNYIQ